jgi:D-sedoheptulose 7-phosphate isomerase
LQKKRIFICGNGGSGANSNHISNDLMLGFKKKIGFPIISLSSNIAKISCIANDIGYEKIFSNQLKVIGQKKDLLIILSGSGNSKNIINVVEQAKKMKICTFELIGYDGGRVKKKLDDYIHFKTNNMQICEDMQMIVMNFVLQKITCQKFKF